MEHQKNEPLPVELSSQLIRIITTEHYNIQTGRSMSISEANHLSADAMEYYLWESHRCCGNCGKRTRSRIVRASERSFPLAHFRCGFTDLVRPDCHQALHARPEGLEYEPIS
jgi:hypothetical protein